MKDGIDWIGSTRWGDRDAGDSDSSNSSNRDAATGTGLKFRVSIPSRQVALDSPGVGLFRRPD